MPPAANNNLGKGLIDSDVIGMLRKNGTIGLLPVGFDLAKKGAAFTDIMRVLGGQSGSTTHDRFHLVNGS